MKFSDNLYLKLRKILIQNFQNLLEKNPRFTLCEINII